MKEDVRPGIYRHFKGNKYRVICTAVNSETLEKMVVYKALYGEMGIWGSSSKDVERTSCQRWNESKEI